MTDAEIRRIFLEELVSVAPDINLETLDDEDHLQDDLELDSMDFLNLIMALHKRFGVSVPEADYPHIATPGRALRYFARALE